MAVGTEGKGGGVMDVRGIRAQSADQFNPRADAHMIHELASRLSADLTTMARISRAYGVANATTDRLIGAEEILEFIVEHVDDLTNSAQ